ncbi:Asp-tRNA(Asn)/Glu-tRNA(Gln) amidotransferase subunit GatA [Candidatus Woesearchaeota archaeon]|nr:Asp-tRNA(Asn)/Glu-tRNA(Gln) amidotransferase subunit GatA [Candidatus Woesearchaeota archaeon]
MNEYINKIKNKEIDIVEHTHKVIEECKKINKEYNYFNIISEKLALAQATALKKDIEKNNVKNKKLLGVMVSAKDAICVKGVESTAGSKILKGYKPLFDATAIKKAVEQGAIIIGKTSQDEFGFGSFAVNTYNIPKNPHDKTRSCGGSSGGAAGITAKAHFPHIALGESTGGSIAAPASFCGVFGLTPTYGRVSRYGLMDFGNSLDKIGPIGKTIGEVSALLETISGHDDKESTSLNNPIEKYSNIKADVKGMKIGIIKEAFGNGVEKAVDKTVWEGIKKLEDAGAKVEEISLAMPIEYGLATYYLIGTSEASTNLAKYCGMRYGASEDMKDSFNEYFTKVRSNNFTEESKRRIMLGTFARMSGYRDAYYIKALKVRTKIIEEYKKQFKKYDALVSPTVPVLPTKFSEIEKLSPLQHYMMDVMLVGPNLAGLPHMNVPVGFENKLPVGMLLIGNHLEENKLLQLGNEFENE